MKREVMCNVHQDVSWDTVKQDCQKSEKSSSPNDSGGMLFAFLTFNPANKEQEGMGSVDLLPS